MNETFTEIFDHIVARQPDHAAILTDGAETVTYRQLKQWALRIAATLPAGDAGRIVALEMEKSAGYLAAVLGCWYARAAFLPLDPALPQDRRARILDEAQPVAILNAASIDNLPQADFTSATPQAADTAYVIYTSGSTGMPKGVVVTHSGLLPVLQQQIALFELSPQSRSLFYLSIAFDASVSDFGTALLAGATLCIETGGKIETAAGLASLVATRGITYADLPPALLRLLEPAQMPDSLRCICIGGEVCPPETVRAWAATRRIVCVYGPTEATICTSASICGEDWTAPLIGAPLNGVTYHILDRRMRACDDGELYIGGNHLAGGYLRQPELTAQKFVLHNGQRLYKTGDHVQRTDKGIVFLGRMDRQFKWRGQLVEPEEIEQALARQNGVSRAAVLRTTRNGQERLVAHVEMTEDNDTERLTHALQNLLPEWMIPSAIIRHRRLPLTATGKVNFAALALHAADAPAHGALFTPVTKQEGLLLACWQRVLGRADIPADTPFSALGGDSFALLQLLLEAERAGLTLDAAFATRHRTLAAQARHLHGNDGETDMQDAGNLRRHLAQHYPLPPAPAGKPSVPQNILLTGATGFLGGQLLRRMLEQTGWTVFALVRAKDAESGWHRLNLAPEWRARVQVVTGDIGQPQLGLSQDLWHHLAGTIDTVMHCAATVNMAHDFATLETANLRPLHDLLQFCAAGKAKHLHHASTLSVFVATDRNTGIAREDDDLQETTRIYGGYAQSKWAAERLLLQAQKSGFAVTSHRLGLVTGDSRSGLSSAHDYLCTFAEGVIALGCVPQGAHEDLLVDVTPVDYAAAMMLAVMKNGGTGACHIANRGGFSLGQILRGLGRLGHNIKTATPAEWQARLAAAPLSPAQTAAVMALCRITPPPTFDRHRAMDLFQATGIVFDCTRLQEITGDGYRPAPTPDDALLDLYLRAFQLRQAA